MQRFTHFRMYINATNRGEISFISKLNSYIDCPTKKQYNMLKKCFRIYWKTASEATI